nr:hypothetical protein [Ensifer sp. IC4062]
MEIDIAALGLCRRDHLSGKIDAGDDRAARGGRQACLSSAATDIERRLPAADPGGIEQSRYAVAAKPARIAIIDPGALAPAAMF